jgi:hypothetical protein
MAVSYTVNGDSFQAEKPRVWLAKVGSTSGFDLSPDGKRIAVLIPADAPEATQPDHEVVFLFKLLRRTAAAGSREQINSHC